MRCRYTIYIVVQNLSQKGFIPSPPPYINHIYFHIDTNSLIKYALNINL